MLWTPRHGHVTQLRFNPTTGGIDGRDDCFEASMARYLFEMNHPASRGLTDDQLIDQIRLAATGIADAPGQPGTTLPECEAAFAHFGLHGVAWTNDAVTAVQAPWAICLVTAQDLRPAQYPAGWLPALESPNHFILWLPAYGGCFDYFNDPLVQSGDVHYDLASLHDAFGGAYILPDLEGLVCRVTTACALKVNPNHLCKALSLLPAGVTVTRQSEAAGWTKITALGKTGYVPDEKLSA